MITGTDISSSDSKSVIFRKKYDIKHLKRWVYKRTSEHLTGISVEISRDEKHIFETSVTKKIFRELQIINQEDRNFDAILSNQQNYFDTVFSLSYHLKRKEQQLNIITLSRLLKVGGHLITCIPVYTALFDGLNAGILSWDIFNKKDISILYGSAFKLVKVRYFLLSHKTTIEESDSNNYKTFYKVTPVFEYEGQIEDENAGLYVLAVGKKLAN